MYKSDIKVHCQRRQTRKQVEAVVLWIQRPKNAMNHILWEYINVINFPYIFSYQQRNVHKRIALVCFNPFYIIKSPILMLDKVTVMYNITNWYIKEHIATSKSNVPKIKPVIIQALRSQSSRLYSTKLMIFIVIVNFREKKPHIYSNLLEWLHS